jgi:CubicO group peptidase (beta-lactamase class C family)
MGMVRHAVIALIAVAGCLPNGSLKRDGSVVPANLGDGWEIATPESVGLNPAALASLHSDLLSEDRNLGTIAVLIVKDGKLVWEAYVRDPADRDRLHHIESVTKGMTSLAFGVARDQGLFPSLDAPIEDFIPDAVAGLGPQKAAITLDDLLTMRSGLAFDNRAFAIEIEIDRPANPLRYMLMKPLTTTPGTTFDYHDVDPQTLVYILERALGESEEAWVKRRLFAPLGISDYLWEHGSDGVTMAAHGLYLRARDMAKFGQLLLDGGRWQGTQVVSQDWITNATSPHVNPDPQHPQDAHRFGYYFWTMPPNVSKGAYDTIGAGGQIILVIPEKQMVIVQVALPDASVEQTQWHDLDFLMKIF